MAVRDKHFFLLCFKYKKKKKNRCMNKQCKVYTRLHMCTAGNLRVYLIGSLKSKPKLAKEKTQRMNQRNEITKRTHVMNATASQTENGNFLKIDAKMLICHMCSFTSSANAIRCSVFIYAFSPQYEKKKTKKKDEWNRCTFASCITLTLIVGLPFFVNSRYQYNITELLIVQICLHIMQNGRCMIVTMKIFILLADCTGRC